MDLMGITSPQLRRAGKGTTDLMESRGNLVTEQMDLAVETLARMIREYLISPLANIF